eukprot:8993879-Pyramimonas_sp.AAC.1
MGWSVIALPGAPIAGHLPTAGVAVFARNGIGLRWSPASNTSEIVAPRAQHIQVDVPGWPTLGIFNIYLYTCEGMTVRHAAILAKIGEEMAGLTHPALIGGDWNM